MNANFGAIILLFVISIANSVGQILMRWGGDLAHKYAPVHPTLAQWLWHSRWWLAGLILGWFCGLGWAFCLRSVSLTIALPIYTGLAYVLSALGGVWLLRERLSPVQMAGVLIILLGMLLLMSPFSAQSKS